MRKKTILNVLLIILVLAFFVTPLGFYGKVLLNRIFAAKPEVILASNRAKLSDYEWKLKDAEWNFFPFEKSKGNVVFINFWASWRLPCIAELQGIQELYDVYKEKVDFYIITNEERAPVEEFMKKNKFTFPVTYLIIGEKAPFEVLEAPGSYLIDKNGEIVIKEEGISDWNNTTISNLLENLVSQ